MTPLAMTGAIFALALCACSSTPAPVDSAVESGADAAMDASTADATVGAACSFNADCPPAERCACSETDGCHCTPGARGTGVAGAPCATGDDCASALCVEGPGGPTLCSTACAAPTECPAALPRCIDVPTVGMFCARASDAGGDAGASGDAALPGCTGACATTALTARFGATTEPFNRAQHGAEGADGVHLEAHFGGDPACPTMTSPTPDRTLVISGVHANGSAAAQTYADGVRATLFDYRGTLTSAPLLRATAVQITPRVVARGVAVAYDFTADFPGGTIAGNVYAPHCTSLDGP